MIGLTLLRGVAPWLKSLNVWAIAVLLLLGASAVIGSYIAGIRHEQRKWALEMAERNAPILEQRGKDEAEMTMEAEMAKAVDAAVAAAQKQRFVLDEATAELLSRVR